MKVTDEMVQAARRAEYDYYQRSRRLGSDRFVPTPDLVIRTMLEAALRWVDAGEPKQLSAVQKKTTLEAPSPGTSAIVIALRPRPRQ
jgi:hypothetical protein